MNMDVELPARQDRRRRRGLWVTASIVLFLLVGCPALTLVVWQASGRQRVEAMKAAIRARGEPLSREDIQAIYALPEGRENTAPIWLDALAGLSTRDFEESAGNLPVAGTGTTEIPPPSKRWRELAAAEALLAKYRTNIAGLHEAAGRGGAARFSLPFGHSSLGLFFRLESSYCAAKLLVLEAHVHAHQGRPHAVVESIRTLHRLAEVQNEPLHLSQEIRAELGAMSAALCCRMLSDVAFPDEDLQRLYEDYRAVRYDDGLYRALVVEQAIGIAHFETPELSRDLVESLDVPGLSLTYHDDLTLYLDMMERYIAGSRKPYHQARQDFQAAAQQLPYLDAGMVHRFRYRRTMLLRPFLSSRPPQSGRGAAHLEAAMAAIAIERYRRREGRFPERLEQLRPDFLTHLPLDPFDGQALRYLVQPDGYVLYSIGEDGTDEGGQDAGERDIVFRIRRLDSP